MEKKFIAYNKNKKLVVIFAGWATSPQFYKDFIIPDADVLLINNYKDFIELETHDEYIKIFSLYDTINVFAWSLGVWVASYFFTLHEEIKVSNAIAFAGTPYPIDDEKGITKAIFLGTANNLNEKVLMKFQLRMCGNREAFDEFNERNGKMDIDELKAELLAIIEAYERAPQNSFRWDTAYIGKSDKIFLPENQQRAWGNTKQILLEVQHYDLQLLKYITQNLC